MSISLTSSGVRGRAAYQYPGKWLNSGNRCDHVPNDPNWHKYVIPKTKASPPASQMKLLKSARNYYLAPSILPTLMNLNGKQNKDGAPRQNRSDGREAEVLVLLSILSFTEYASLRIGTPLPNGAFVPRSCGEIAKRVGMIEPGRPDDYPYPNGRFWRAWRRLKLAGAFTVHAQYEEVAPNVKRARKAIKCLNEDFLVSLGGVGFAEMKRFRDYCSEQIAETRAAYNKENPEEGDALEASRRVQLKQEAAGAKVNMPVKKETKEIPDANKENQEREHYSRQRLAYQKELIESGELSLSEVKRKTDSEYPPFDKRPIKPPI